jgi:2-oxoisovalerate dehydrogenase E1 component
MKIQSVNELVDWKKVLRTIFYSRAMDDLEESELVPEKKVMYQFSARGHELVQVVLGSMLTHPHDAVSAYYRSRPLLLSLGLNLEDAMAAPMAKSGGYSDGRDIGVVCNLPGDGGPVVLPMAGDVGSQYTPATGWAQALEYRRNVLSESACENAISVIFGGDGSVATNGFWSALTIATTKNLPVLFCIEDNGYGLSVTSDFQTPGGNIAENLRSFRNLKIIDGDGTNPEETLQLSTEAVQFVRERRNPLLLRMMVPRLQGHSYQDNQAYKDPSDLESDKTKDPLVNLEEFLIPNVLTRAEWDEMKADCIEKIRKTAEQAWSRADPDPGKVLKYRFAEYDENGEYENPEIGGLDPDTIRFSEHERKTEYDGQRINFVEAIRKTLDIELAINDRLVIFGEDVGVKGGVHAATLGLQGKYGQERVFDTSLSEEGIVGRAVGMAYAGLMPVAEIQFRKYADPATEQLKNCGTVRWRTVNKFAAPIVVRMPGGFAKCGDPWHSESNEVFFAHLIGWHVAFPSNAEDATGLLRTAMRGNNPVIFFEHRNLLDSKYARRPYPGDHHQVDFGKANVIRKGTQITIITWGAMCERCESAVEVSGIDAEIIDLRTLVPWDQETVLNSVKKTNRCLIVHEDSLTAGFGAEISAVLTSEIFRYLDAPIERLAVPDIPVPYNIRLMNSILPDSESISSKLQEITGF